MQITIKEQINNQSNEATKHKADTSYRVGHFTMPHQ